MANESGNVRPEPPLVFLREATADDADGLAGESAADEVGSGQLIGVQLLDVAPAGYLRPVLGEHPLAVRVDLDLANAGPSGPLEAEVETADAGEQVEEGRATHSPRLPGELGGDPHDRRAAGRGGPALAGIHDPRIATLRVGQLMAARPGGVRADVGVTRLGGEVDVRVARRVDALQLGWRNEQGALVGAGVSVAHGAPPGTGRSG